METMRRKQAEEEEPSEEEEDQATMRARLRQREQDSDLKHAEDLIGSIGLNKSRTETKGVVVMDPKDPTSTVDLATLPLFNPNTKEQFLKLRETLVPVLAANSKKAQYSLFMQEFSKQIVKELPSDQIKKIASGLTTLSNEKMKEEKLAEKGGKKSKAAKSKATLVANRDTSFKADTTSYADADDDDDFMWIEYRRAKRAFKVERIMDTCSDLLQELESSVVWRPSQQTAVWAHDGTKWEPLHMSLSCIWQALMRFGFVLDFGQRHKIDA